MLLTVMQVLIMLNFSILSILNYNSKILNIQLKKLKKLLIELSGFKSVKTLVLELKKIENDDKTKNDTFYSHSKVETITNESGIDDDVFKSLYTPIISNIHEVLGKGSG